MSSDEFRLRIEWLDAPGVREAAIASTFARLEVWVEGSCVTRAFDQRARTVVEGIHISLLPLATWAVDTWWTACFEAPRTRKLQSVREARDEYQRGWHRRHGWLASREGFMVPELVFSRGDADAVRVDWFRDPPPSSASPLRFLESGTALVARDLIQDDLSCLVEGTLARCAGLTSPAIEALQRRWTLLRSASAEESRVCERAARMGLDAYDVDEVDDDLAELLAGPVPLAEPILDDLLDVVSDDGVTSDDLRCQVEQLEALLNRAGAFSASHDRAPDLSQARERLQETQGRPFERGYKRARMLRQEVLGLNDDAVAATLDRAIDTRLLPDSSLHEESQAFLFRGIHSLVAAPANVPFVITRLRHPTGRRFDRARALYALTSSDAPHLLTAGFDAEQQASRAFAAELLAPAETLRTRLSSRVIDHDELERLAAEFRVGAELIRRQIENHVLAEVADV